MHAQRDEGARSAKGRCWVGGLGAVLALLVLAWTVAKGSGARSVFVQWRCPARDGVNCLYLQISLMGYAGTYEGVVAALPDGPEQTSLDGLGKAAQRLGFPLAPCKLTVAELSSLALPTVVLFEETDIGRGRFHLLVNLSPSEARMVDGSFIIRGERMPIDRFRRGWTGFALVRRSTPAWRGLTVGVAAGAMMGGAAGWLVRRITRGWPQLPDVRRRRTHTSSREVV